MRFLLTLAATTHTWHNWSTRWSELYANLNDHLNNAGIVDTIQVICFFVISYLLSRVFVKLKIPELILYYLFEKRHISIQKLTFYLLLGTALISTIIANLITVLTLLPIVLILQKELSRTHEHSHKINTLVMLCIMWGANIGGIGMITGTATNGVLVGLFELYKIPQASEFSFISWAAWGLPLTVVMVLAGWSILMLVFQPGKIFQTPDFGDQLESLNLSRRMQKVGYVLAGIFIVVASVLSYLLSRIDIDKLYILIATVICTLLYLYAFLLYKWKKENGERMQLLQRKDILTDFPKKGLIWIGLAIVLTYVLWQLKLHRYLVSAVSGWVSNRDSMFLLCWFFALISTFASEVISNSAVQLTMFMVLFPLAKTNPTLSWQGMLVISLCSTCAFMSPLATPSNALGFGASSKVSMRHMLFSGFLMNISSSTLIAFWVVYIVPFVLNLFIGR